LHTRQAVVDGTSGQACATSRRTLDAQRLRKVVARVAAFTTAATQARYSPRGAQQSHCVAIAVSAAVTAAGSAPSSPHLVDATARPPRTIESASVMPRSARMTHLLAIESIYGALCARRRRDVNRTAMPERLRVP
jgi:hypothetical protein